MRGCVHNIERTIEHRATGERHVVTGASQYQYGDLMIFVCPRGCEDIEAVIGDNREEDV